MAERTSMWRLTFMRRSSPGTAWRYRMRIVRAHLLCLMSKWAPRYVK